MRRSCLGVITPLLAVTLLLAGCRNTTDNTPVPPIGGATPSPTATPTPTPSPTPDDPFAIPAEGIDEAYTERVINELLRIVDEVDVNLFDYELGESLREEDRNRVLAVFAGKQFRVELDVAQRAATDADHREAVRKPPEQRTPSRFEAEAVLHAEEHCILVAGFYDLSGSIYEPPFVPGEFALFSLSRLPEDFPHADLNPTPWRIHHIVALVDTDDNPIPPEVWDDLEMPDFLDRTCQEV